MDDKIDRLKLLIQERLISEMDLKRLNFKEAGNNLEKGKEIKQKIKEMVERLLNEEGGFVTDRQQREKIILELLDDILGLGPLEKLLRDPAVSEIMVNKKDEVYIEQQGKIKLTGIKLSSNRQILTIIERIVAPLGRHIDESSPLVDARLKDGSRVNAIIPPLALDGPVVTIRKFIQKKLIPDDLIGLGSISKEMIEFIRICVQLKKNIIISGGTGSGKTTLLNIISSFIPQDERIITIEDSAELKLPQKHVVRLESRPPNIEGEGEISIRRLLINCLRMRPDRIIIGECRGGEAIDMLQAMNTGHEGSLTTLHANSPRDSLSRLETMALMSGMELPSRVIRDQIASTINIIVQQNRLGDGTRKITCISEITGFNGDIITITDIFKFIQEGINDQGKIIGKFEFTGVIPSFIAKTKSHNVFFDRNIFRNT
ncbi:CpaF family protein [bacterium]|nr:CpaF family protein [bacterium]